MTGQSTITGALTTVAGSELNVSFAVNSSLTISNGFTNNGTISLSNSNVSQFTQLIISSGTLVNAAGGVITTDGDSNGTPTNRSINGNLDLNGGDMSLGVNMRVTGLFSVPDNGPVITGPGGLTIPNTGEVDVLGAVFDTAPFTIDGATITTFDQVTFQNMDVTSTQLTVDHPGAAAAFDFDSLIFSTEPTLGVGFYVDANDTGGADTLTINLPFATAVDGPTHTVTTGGAVVSWP